VNNKIIFNFRKAQGALEYLLLIGGAVLIAVIVIALLVGMGGQSRNTAQNQSTQAQQALEQPQPASIVSVVGLKSSDQDSLVAIGLDEDVLLTNCQGIGGSGWFRIDWQELGPGGVHVLKFYDNQNLEQPVDKITIYNITSETDLVKTNPPQLTENSAAVFVEDLTSYCSDTQWVEIDTEKNGQIVKSTRYKFYWPSNSIIITNPVDDPVVTILEPIEDFACSCEDNIIFNLSTENISYIDNNYWYLNQSLPNDVITVLPSSYFISGNNKTKNATELLADSDLSFGDNNVSAIVSYNLTVDFLKSSDVNIFIDYSSCNSSCINIVNQNQNKFWVYIGNSCSDDFENYTFSLSSDIDSVLYKDQPCNILDWRPAQRRFEISKHDFALSSGDHIFTFSYYDENGDLIALNSGSIPV